MIKNLPANAGGVETWAPSLDGEDPLEKEMATHSCLENPMDRVACRATVHRVTESDTTEHCTAQPLPQCDGVWRWGPLQDT